MGLRKWARRAGGPAGETLSVQILCLGLLFALGMLGGYLYAAYCAGDSRLLLSEYLSGYCALYRSGGAEPVALLTAARLYGSYVLAAFLLGYVSAGVAAVPLLSGLYGFLTMFSVACFVQVYGRGGCLLALAVFGPRAVFTVPCFLWMAACAWACASSRIARGGGKRCAPVSCGGAYVYRFFVCIVVLMLGVCVERYVTPSLFQWALDRVG